MVDEGCLYTLINYYSLHLKIQVTLAIRAQIKWEAKMTKQSLLVGGSYNKNTSEIDAVLIMGENNWIQVDVS